MIRSFPFSEHPNVGTAIIELSNYFVLVSMVAEYSVAVGLFRIFEHNQDEEHFWIRFVTINLESQ